MHKKQKYRGQTFRLKRLARALGGISCMAAGSEMALAQCATTYTSTQTNTSLSAGSCVNITAGSTGAWELGFVGNYTAAGNNALTVNTKGAITLDTVTGPSDSISVTLNGPMSVTSTATTIGNAWLLYVFAQDPLHMGTVTVNSDFTGAIAGFDPRGITAWGNGASIAFHGVTEITASGYGTYSQGSGVLFAQTGGKIVSDKSIKVRALNQSTSYGIAGIYAGNASVELSGHVDVEVSSLAKGADIQSSALTVTGTDDTSRVVGGVGISAIQGSTVQLTRVTVQSLAGDALVMSGVGPTLSGVDVTLDATGGAGVNISGGVAGISATDATRRSSITTHGAGAHGILAGGDGAITIERTNILVNDANASGIVSQGTAAVTLGAATSIQVNGSGPTAFGLLAQAGTITAQGSATDAVAITTAGAGSHGLELAGGRVNLGQTRVTTTGAGAYGLHLGAGTLTGTAGLAVTTQADATAGVVLDPTAAGAVTLSLDPSTTITTQGQNADGLSVRGLGSLTLDGTGLSPANISVARGALLEAENGASIALRGGAVFGSADGTRAAGPGADPLTWGAKAASGGTITLADAISANGNGLWAAAGGTLRFLDTASAPNAVVRLDAASGGAAGTLDASGHAGPLTLGYLEGAGTVNLGANALLLGGTQPLSGAYTFSGAINGTASLTKTGTNTQILTGPAAWGFSGDAYLEGGVLALTNVGDTTQFTKTFHINGGWLDLSGSNVPFDPGNPQTAANWGIRVLDEGGGGGVIGVNDNLVVTGGQTVAYQIGNSGSPKGVGLYVSKEGAGTARLTGENQYVGATQIKEGTLQVTRDANLCDTTLAREIKLMGGSLQLSSVSAGSPSTFASSRMVQLYRDGSVSVDDGVAATLGSLISVGRDAAFTKAGAGSLSFGAATLTGGLTVQQGALAINGGTITHAAGGAAITAANGTSVTLANVALSGSTVYALAAGAHAVFTARASTLNGAVTADGAAQGAVLDATFSGGTQLSGVVTPTNGAQINLTLADANTTWKLNGNASVNTLANLGSIAFVQQPAASGAGPYYTLAVGGDYRGGGSLTRNTFLNTGGAPANSFTDRLLIAGNVSGVTTLQVNAQGTGGNTNGRGDSRFHADEGISLVQVKGHAAMNSFQLDRPYVVAPGSIYQYRLFAYGPQSTYGPADPSTAALWDYRLQSAYEDQNGDIVPGTDPNVRPMVLPQTGAYLIAPLALQRYGAMVMDSLHARLGDMRRQSAGAAGAPPEVFARVMAETGTYDSNVPWRQYGVDFSQRSEAVQFGGNFARVRLGERDSLRVGIAGTVGASTATPKDGAGLPSKLSVQAQSLALSATWENLAGWYADAIVAGNFYRASVNGPTREVGTMYGTGLDVSLEGGKRVELPGGWQVETRAQLMRQSVFFRDMTDKDGTLVTLGTSHAWTTQAGVRFSYPIQTVSAFWTPYLALGLSYTWLGGATPVLAGTAFTTGNVGAAGRMAVGASGQLTPRLALYGELNAQASLDNYGVSAIGGRLGVRYQF